jgi:hypothetical protein
MRRVGFKYKNCLNITINIIIAFEMKSPFSAYSSLFPSLFIVLLMKPREATLSFIGAVLSPFNQATITHFSSNSEIEQYLYNKIDSMESI